MMNMDSHTEKRTFEPVSPEEAIYLEMADLLDGLPPNVGLPMLVALATNLIVRSGPEHAFEALGLVTADLSGRVTSRLSELKHAAH